MRILHLSMLYPPHLIGGAERSVAVLAETQAAAGHQVAAACTTPGPSVREERNGVTVFRMPHETPFWAEDWPKHGPLARAWRKFRHPFNRRLTRRFEAVLDAFRPDIVHTHSMVDVSTRLWPAAAKRGYPILHTLRDYDLLCADGSMYHGGAPCGLKCRIMTAAKAPHHRSIAGVTAVGGETLRIHIERGFFADVPEDRRAVIWNSAPVRGGGADYIRPSRTGQPITFGYLGRISEEKGVATLIAAARLLDPAGGWRVVVAGKSGGDGDPFIRAAGGLPIEFAGFLEPLAFFERIDVLVVPSIWAEPMGRIVVEAYEVGVPVIGSRAGGIPDLIGHDNDDWLFPPGDATALAARMAMVLARGREALPPRSSFAATLAQTRPDVVMARYMEIYERVLAARRPKGIVTT